MTFVTRGLNQTLTYWGSPVYDGRGGYTYDSPITINGRWEDRTEIFIDGAAKEKRSQAVVFVDRDVEEEGYLALGDWTDSAYDDPVDCNSALKIKAFKKIPNVKATDFGRKVWL